jgi:hypothetical protein
VTPGLPTAFGARYVLNIWFPPPQNNDSSSDSPQRFIIGFPGNSSSTTTSTAGRVQRLPDVQGIVAIEPRRFFANISATNDYSYLDTPILSAQQDGNSNDTGKLVRRRREKNPRMPAYIAQQLAWGSPPVGGTMVRPAVLHTLPQAVCAGSYLSWWPCRLACGSYFVMLSCYRSY